MSSPGASAAGTGTPGLAERPVAALQRVERLLELLPVARGGEAAGGLGAGGGELGRVGVGRGRRDREHRPRLPARAQRRVRGEDELAQPRPEGGGDVDRRRPARRRPRLEGAVVGVARRAAAPRPRRAPRSAGPAPPPAAASAAPARRSRGSCRSSPRPPRARAPPPPAPMKRRRMRSRSSPAAFSVNVSARIEPTVTPSCSTASTHRSAIWTTRSHCGAAPVIAGRIQSSGGPPGRGAGCFSGSAVPDRISRSQARVMAT